MSSGISIFLGGMAVLPLFVGSILLLAPLFDKLESRAKAAEAQIRVRRVLKRHHLPIIY